VRDGATIVLAATAPQFPHQARRVARARDILQRDPDPRVARQLCTLEIDRAFATSLAADFKNPVIAKHVAVSLFWSLFAISSVSAGFRFRTAFLRYFGLGLFGATLLKVAILDISQVEYGYRVLSLIGLGLVLLVTSVLYGYVSPKLLNAERPQDEAVRPAANEENVILNK